LYAIGAIAILASADALAQRGPLAQPGIPGVPHV
jgi:hypothetical protein